MFQLFEKETRVPIGTISAAQLQFLKDHLEEEAAEDRDYYVNLETVDLLESKGGDKELIGLLRRALMTREELEFNWK